MWAVWFTTGAAFIVIACTALPLLRHEAWWIRAFDFPRVQLMFAAGLVLVAFVSVVGWNGWTNVVLIAALAVCFAYQLSCIIPYTPLWPKQLLSAGGSNADNAFSLLSANVLTPNRNAEGLLRLVRKANPDVFLAIETDAWWDTQLNDLKIDYPHSVRHPLDNLYGMHLYSRLPLVEAEVKFLVESDKPSIHARIELRSGQFVNLYCLHPAPPAPNENDTSQERDAELIIVAKTIDECDQPAVVIGDLNDVAWSATTRLFQKVSGLLDPRVGRGMFNTFHAKYPFLRWPLDHVFCSGNFTLMTLKRLDAFGSDHFPIHAVLKYTSEAEDRQSAPEAKEADLVWADDKVEGANGLTDNLRSAVA